MFHGHIEAGPVTDNTMDENVYQAVSYSLGSMGNAARLGTLYRVR